MAQMHELSDARFLEILKSVRSTGSAKVDEPGQRLREHVVLSSAFDAASLPGAGSGPTVDPEIDRFLARDCELVSTRGGEKWRLRADVRRETLAELDRTGRLGSVTGGADPLDVGYAMARRYIDGDAPSLAEQSLDELQGTATASEWLSDTKVRIPTAEEARGQRTIENLLRPLRMLVAEGFVGRRAELQQLSDYAEVLPPSSRKASASRRVRRFLRRNERPPLLIHAPGGAGKSTLVARFILDHVDAGAAHRFPFAYLSFDRQELRIDQPLTLLADAAGQLAALFPKVAAEAVALSHTARASVAAADASRLAPHASKSGRTVRSEDTAADEEILLVRYAALVEAAVGNRDHPHVWVLDTFEVAQRQSPNDVDTLWAFLDRFQDHCPRLRVVMCGRVPMEGHQTVDLPLAGLDRASALHLLRQELAGVDLPDQFLSAIVDTVSSHPLSLRLAAQALRTDGAAILASEEARRQFLFGLRDSSVQGVLLRRILAHIADPEVRKLAEGCLVVRVVTPGVIRHVLARPAGLVVKSDARARDLFERLAGEVALVQRHGPDELVARSDLRKVALPLLRDGSPESVEKIQASAVRYFSKQDSFAAKVEELYYRLCLGQSTATLDKAFDRAAGLELAEVSEFPAASQVYLATKLGLTVRPELLSEADDLSWARQAALTARRLLDAGKAEEALAVVSERHIDVSLSFTAAIEVEALASLRRFDEALSVADHWATAATDQHDSDTFIDLRLLTARIAEDTGDMDQALRWLREIDALVRLPKQLPDRLAARVAIVRIHRKSGTSQSDEATRMRKSLVEDAGSLTARDRSRDPSLVRDLAAEIGSEVPSLARDALRLGGYKDAPAAPAKGKPRKRPPAKASLTQSERGQELTESMDEEVTDVVTETFRAEADASPFA